MYNRLPFEQYFIDTSNDYGHTGRARFKIKFKDIPYEYKGKTYHANYLVRYEPDRKTIQIYFEDTDGKLDWKCNFMFIDKYYDSFYWGTDKITLRVHEGWARMYKAMKHYIRREVQDYLKINNKATIEIIGWSLGSAMAQLCAQDLYFNFGIRAHLFTYGSVNPFKTNKLNRRLIKKYLRFCCAEAYNFSNRNDIVSYLPFKFLGFRKIRRVRVGDRFCLFKIFRPTIYHTTYWKSELYKDIC